MEKIPPSYLGLINSGIIKLCSVMKQDVLLKHSVKLGKISGKVSVNVRQDCSGVEVKLGHICQTQVPQARLVHAEPPFWTIKISLFTSIAFAIL